MNERIEMRSDVKNRLPSRTQQSSQHVHTNNNTKLSRIRATNLNDLEEEDLKGELY